MAGEKFTGVVTGRIVEVRFPFSGTVAEVKRYQGDLVKRGELLATLDTSSLQKELDIQLADYEQARADFEIFHLKNKSSDPVTEYLKKSQQDRLNISVKAVEAAKAKLDQSRLSSPVAGLILDLSDIVPGLHITPSGFAIKILDYSGFSFRMVLAQEMLSAFRQPHRARINIPNLGRNMEGTTTAPLPVGSDSKPGFVVDIRLDPADDLLPGMSGEAELLS